MTIRSTCVRCGTDDYEVWEEDPAGFTIGLRCHSCQMEWCWGINEIRSWGEEDKREVLRRCVDHRNDVVKAEIENSKAEIENSNVVICENNSGMEECFDRGVEYVAEDVEEDGMVAVFDKTGERRVCFMDRFKWKVARAR